VTSAQARDLAYGFHELRAQGCQEPASPQPAALDESADAHLSLRQDRLADAIAQQDIPTYSADQIHAGPNQLLLTSDPDSVKSARDFTAETLRGWHLDDLIDEGVMIASELVTNAVRHGACLGGPGTGKVGLTWQRHASRVVCVVTDGSSLPPVLAPPDTAAESGRGLHVVNSLAAAWGWTMVGAGEKAVWAALPLC
jgi:anti-sigma regulatory factor (Ser/Thr protein kinase)